MLRLAFGGLMLALWVPGTRADPERIIFSNLSSRAGLAEGPVVQIVHDSQGRIWFAQRRGLARFDGNELRVVLDVKQHYEGRTPAAIQCFTEAEGSGFWVGTDSGLLLFFPETNTSKGYNHQPGLPTSLSHDSVTALLRGGRDYLWVGTESGLNRLQLQSGDFTHVAVPPLDREVIQCLYSAPETSAELWVGTKGSGLQRLRSDGSWENVWSRHCEISAITSCVNPETGETTLWVGTKGDGLMECNREGKPLKRHLPQSDGRPSAARDICSLFVDSENILWVGTASGLSRFDAARQNWTAYSHERDWDRSLARGAVASIHEDRRGVLWIGTDSGEVSRYRLDQRSFPHYRAEPGCPDLLIHSSVWGLCESADGKVWVGTENGLDRFNPESGTCEHWTYRSGEDGGLPHPYVYSVLEDRKQRVWLGSRGGGLARMEGGKEPFRHFVPEAGKPGSLPGDVVSALYEDRSGRIWLAVPGSGLLWYDEAAEAFHPAIGAGDDSPRFVNRMVEAADGQLWAGTTQGLWRWDSQRERLVHYRDLAPISDSLPAENVTALAGSRNGGIWIGTAGAGVSYLERENGSLTHFQPGELKGVACGIGGLAEDNQGNVWISSAGGLDLFNPASRSYRHFTPEDGVQSTQFHPGALLQLRKGTLLAGGPEGLDVIEPKEIPALRRPSRPILTGLDLFGQPVAPAPGSLLPRPIAAMGTTALHFPFDPKLRFALRFGNLDYSSLDHCQFEYRLEGYDDTWQKAKADRLAAYQRPAPGQYRFEVRASPDGSQWLELMHPLLIVIDPPWYRTVWALAGFGIAGMVLLFGGTYAFFRIRDARERAQRARLESERNRAEAALSLQVQHSMLLERTSAEFQRNLDSAQVFEAALRWLGEHFKTRRCFLAALSEDGKGLEVLAQFSAPGLTPVRFNNLSTTHPIAARVLAATGAVNLATEDVLSLNPEPCPDSGSQDQCVWGVRTAYLERPNGVIVLHQDGAIRTWTKDDLRLLESLAGQMGIAVAQFLLSQREARQAQELQEARVAADMANRAKSDFLARMTHELRTPLNAIIGFSEVLSLEGRLEEAQRKHLEIISSSGEHLLGVINDVLEVSKIEEGKLDLVIEPFELATMLHSVHGMLSAAAAKKGIDLHLAVEGELPRQVEADKRKLRQIIVNLLGNAIKFTAKGSVTLRVWSRPEPAPAEALAQGRVPTRLFIQVIDTGEGIAEDELSKLFEKFVQTRSGKNASQGTGLGLAIVKGFTQLMGGRVGVTSAVGTGTEFAVELPIVALEASSGAEAAGQRKGEIAGLIPGHREVRVLVVEDQPVNRLLMRKLLVKAGFTMEEAENGLVAVERWREVNPDIIFMDENMPVMGGSEATRKIKTTADGPVPPIVSLTAFALEDQRRAALEAGCVDFLAKPFKREELFQVIERHCQVTYQYRSDYLQAA